ncbi:MAG: SDR family NAD(P)-dependent oxidoreductase [Bacteroidota bacterium]
MKKSKNIVITGASTGIGYDLAKAFVSGGYRVFGSVRKPEDGDRLMKELGDGFEPLVFDVTNHEQVENAGKLLESKLGEEGLGGLINNAGVAVGGPFMELDIDEFRYQFEVNVMGIIKVTQTFLPLLGAREDHRALPGKIFQISSSAGKIGMPFLSPYVGSKHALEGISQSLRRELLLYGIDVVIIGPGPVKTPIWDKSIGEPIVSKFKRSPWFNSLSLFLNVFTKDAVDKAWTSEKVARIIFNRFEAPTPKSRYALVPQRLKNWVLPNLLSDRTLDKFVKMKLKLDKSSR